MHVHTSFTFENADEYRTFCSHMAKFTGVDVRPATLAVVKPLPTAKQEPVPEKIKEAAPEPKTVSKEERNTQIREAARLLNIANAEANKKAETAETAAPDAVRLADEPTYENIREAVLAVSTKAKSKKPAFDILKTYGLAKVSSEMPDEHFAAIIADCQAYLDAA